MNGITPENLMTTITVALAVFAAIITIDKVIDIIKKWRQPSTDVARKLDNDKKRLDAHEDAIKGIKEESRVVCKALLALLDHELHNGNSDQMQSARDEIIKYLQGLIVR